MEASIAPVAKCFLDPDPSIPSVRPHRRSSRFPLHGKVHLEFGERRFDLPLADISVSGVGVRLDVALLGAKPDGQVGFCRVESPDLACPIEAFVSVMRIRRVGHQHLVGLRFESIGDEQLRVVEAYQALSKARADRAAAAENN